MNSKSEFCARNLKLGIEIKLKMNGFSSSDYSTDYPKLKFTSAILKHRIGFTSTVGLSVGLISCFLCQIVAAQGTIRGLFPAVQELSSFKPIKSSSTCGLQGQSMKYCISKNNQSLITCTERTCLQDCCSTCGRSTPSHVNLESGTSFQVTSINNDSRPGSLPGTIAKRFSTGSYITFRNLQASNVQVMGLSITAWVKQQTGNTGALVSKGTSYSLILTQYDMYFIYKTRDSSLTKNITLRNVNFVWNNWKHVALVVHDRDLSLFVDGIMQRTAVLDGIIDDATRDATIGHQGGELGLECHHQMHGSNQFVGLLQEVKYYSQGLTNREVIEAMNGTFPTVYGYSNCRCPPSHPKISSTNPFFCMKNSASGTADSVQSRLGSDSHPVEYTVDGEVITHWLSTMVENVTIEVDLIYSKLQIYVVQLQFYSPPAKGIKIERSLDRGHTYIPWQYYADDCMTMFNMPNNGDLPEPDSVNCIQIPRPVRPTSETISFQTQEPGPENRPQRPFGVPGCTSFYCSPKLLEFVKSTNVRISLLQHTLVRNANHHYFGIRRIIVGGTCDCNGHATICNFYGTNSTHNASYTCTCDTRTNTQGIQCDRCKPLYNDKPFKRGIVLDAYPCKKCQCYNHADSCIYNSTLDPNPQDRTSSGGGVCVNCKHNTMGRFCDSCKPLFYRPSGKDRSALDVCSPCNCFGAGIVSGRLDCQRDDSNLSVIAGQCHCKPRATGRQCTLCIPGYFKLRAGNPDGCDPCNCITAGTVNANASCDMSLGQCYCKTNVIGLKCDTCRSGFYGLSSAKPEGCSACNCDPWGSTGTVCNTVTGNCPCKSSTEGRHCGACKDGYFGLSAQGCLACRCNNVGTDPARLNLCNKTNGNCYCRQYVEGVYCDRCRVGYYNLSSNHATGCLPCHCDVKGTIGSTGQCNLMNGTCTCKSLVTGRQCNLCVTGTYNLSASNPEGCSRCNCNPKGTVNGDNTPRDRLPCGNDGRCLCLSNVGGRDCGSCVTGYYWNPSGPGCISCNCDAAGSINQNCNATGHCSCVSGRGVGGPKCDQCLPGYYGFSNGRCTPCGCSTAGSLNQNCDSAGKCLQCKRNVIGDKCDQCKPGTANLDTNNIFGCSGVPSQQGPPTVTVLSSRSLGTIWNQPENPNGIILRYELYRNDSLVYNGSALAFNDTGLTPYTLYNYYIITYTAGGSTKSVDSEAVYRTNQDAPEGIATPVITNVLERSLVASWTVPQNPNGIILFYVVRSVRTQDSVMTNHYQGLELTTQVTGLKPFTIYSFSVIACTVIGCKQSGNVTVATRSAAPDSQPAPYCTPLSGGRSIYVYWDPPAQPNGRLLFYDLYVRGAPFSDAGRTVAVNLNPQARNYTVTGLRPYTLYEFRVRSYTSQVKGDTDSNWTRIRTLQSAPSGSEYISPRPTVVYSRSISISWSPPRYPNGIIIRYEVYRYEMANLATPILSSSTDGSKRNSVVTGLQPYTEYQFTVTACNSEGCTSHSIRTTARTFADVPSGQGAPNTTVVNASSVHLSWSLPSTLNGPSPIGHIVERTFSAIYYPNQVEIGIRFPTLGYYQFPANLIPDSARTEIDFHIKTRYSNGLIFFASSSGQEDMIAIELRNGLPWFLFDTEDGPAAFTTRGAVRVDDGVWHQITVSRNRNFGTITVDRNTGDTGTGTGSGTATVIGQISAIYVGGLPQSFRILRSDTGNAQLQRINFVGCLRGLKYKNTYFDFKSPAAKYNLAPLYEHCPSDQDGGFYLKGGGYVGLRNSVFTGGSVFRIQFSLKTQWLNGLIFFASGNQNTMLSLYLQKGDLFLTYKSPSRTDSIKVSTGGNICNGQWHTYSLVRTTTQTNSLIDGSSSSIDVPADVVITSRVYLGGVPVDSQESNIVKQMVYNGTLHFGGCIRSVTFSSSIDIQRDALSFHNVDLDGCARNSTAIPSNDLCRGYNIVSVYNSTNLTTTDEGLHTFTEYLYRVKSYRNGIAGMAESEWVAVRTGEGSPSQLKPPTLAVVTARYIEARWNVPRVSGGLVTKYQLKAYNLINSSAHPLVNDNIDANKRAANITGLDPYTEYGISVVAFTSGSSAESRSVNATTEQDVPEFLDPPSVVAYSTALNVSWKPPRKPNGPIVLYQLNINNEANAFGIIYNSYIDNLNVYTRYTLMLRACNVINCASSQISVYTGQLAPEGIGAPQLRVLGSRRIDVSWTRPSKPNGVIAKYEVIIAERDVISKYVIAFNASASDFQTVISGLTPGKDYYFRIAAFTDNGNLRAVGNASVARTLDSAPEEIPPPIAVPVSPYSINVTILPPNKPHGKIVLYVLFEDDKPVMNSSSLHYQGSGFLPYSRHTYRSRACTSRGCGESDLTTVYTLDAQPNGSIILDARVLGPRSFRANWTAIETPNGIITYTLLVTGEFYVVSNGGGPRSNYQTENRTEMVYNGSQNGIEFIYSQLLPFSFYKIHVNGSNKAGYISSNEVTFTSPAAVPEGVLPPVVNALNSTSLSVTWREPGRANGIIQWYELIGLFPPIDNGPYRQVPFGRKIYLSQEVSSLQPYTNYSFKVVAQNSAGTTESVWTKVITPEDIPESVDAPKVVHIESRSAVIEISPPAKPNGLIIHYIIYVNGSEVNRTLNNRLQVLGLLPFTEYVAAVAACTSTGCRRSGTTNVFKTMQDAPENQPPPSLNANSSRSVIIMWSQPNVTNGIIISYVIQRRISRASFFADVATINASFSGNMYVDRSVQPYTTYDYRVIARTAGGFTAGPHSTVKTPQGAPESVPAPNVIAISSSSLRVRWSPPSKPNGIVTHYYVKLLNGSFLTNGNTTFEYILTGLESYIEYTVIIRACTIGGCGDSPSSTVRTLRSLPSNQPAPTAEVRSATALRVRWDPPRRPNGPILNYILYRRTIEDLVSGNMSAGVSYPTQWIKIFDGNRHIYDDTALGIYSLQQYKVTVITTEGNATSNDSNVFRTAPAVPLFGVTLNASALNHTAVRLTWALPAIRLLRGSAQRFDISYEIVGGAPFVYGSLKGNQSHAVVNNLRPSTNYRFEVSVYNGAGSRNSLPAFVRTLDGVPEGFDAPAVYVVGPRSMRISWNPPRVPNGVITNYTIFANGRSYDTLAGNVRSHVQGGFQPFTSYQTQVRVCTVYSCTMSQGTTAKTLAATPENMEAPTLLPISSTAIRVLWRPPQDENGIMTGYMVYRRHLYQCPISPVPLKKCTYITCSLSEELCGTKCYDPRSMKCCNGTLHSLDPLKSCCGSAYVRKNSPTDVCCGGQFYPQQNTYQCCFNYYTRVPQGQVCCSGRSGVVVGIGNACCGDVPYDINGTKSCICGALYAKFPAIRKCCGGRVVSVAQQCCGNERQGTAYDFDSAKTCCGTLHVQQNSSQCCQDAVGKVMVYNYTTSTERSNYKCCGVNRIPLGSSCCNNRSYDNASSICADRSSLGATDCGTGRTCPADQVNTAYCNRCDFNPATSICNHVAGYYDPASSQSNATVELCSTNYIEILRNPNNALIFSSTDTGLLPHSLYEYYVIGVNTEGNVGSPTNRTRTLMASPERLSRPTATVLSATQIAVTWSTPKKPNGEISGYKLFRLKWGVREELLVFSGLGLSFTDSQGLEPYTGYMYTLSACTVLCTNISAAAPVYTQQARPKQVRPPVLIPISSRSIRVNWSLPVRPNGDITRYNVTMNVNGSYISVLPINDLGLSLTALVSNLKPYTSYTFKVEACTVVGCNTGPSATTRTLQGAPENVRPPVLTIINSRTIEARWYEPSVMNGIILKYVLFRNNVPVYNGTELIYRDTSLLPNTAYNYYVEAYTSGGSTSSTIIRTSTPESSPEGIPSPTITPRSSTGLFTEWSPPSRPNGIITGYSVVYNEPNMDISKHSVRLAQSYLITGLKPYTTYEVRIEACTAQGCGTGNRTASRTLEAPPTGQAPPILDAKTSSIVELKWQPPSLPNGVITRYVVYRREGTSGLQFAVYVGQALEYINTQLKSFTLYQYRVRSQNSAGFTDSSWASVRTLEGLPQGFIAPNVRILSATEAEVTWQSPSQPNGIITGYEVRTREFANVGNETISRCCIQPHIFNITISNMKPATTFEFRIAGINSAGTGFSDWTVAKTKEAPPIGIPTLQADTDPEGKGDGTSMRVFWAEPSSPNGAVTNYVLYLDPYVVYQGLVRSTIIRRLTPYTNYTFRLRVCNSAGCTTGPPQKLLTAEIIPKGQMPPTFGSANATSVTLQWTPPLSPNGHLLRYDVLRRSSGSRRRRQASETTVYSTNQTGYSTYRYVDTGLRPYTNYDYKIRAVNSKGVVDSNWASVRTQEAAPGGLNPPNGTALGGFSMQIQWAIPQHPNGIIRFYEVHRNGSKIHTTTGLSYRDNNLAPVTVYAYTIIVCTAGGCSTSPVVYLRTLQAAPGEMRPPTLTAVDSTRIRATWAQPSVPNGVVQKYQLRLTTNENPVYEGNALEHIVSGLRPFTFYSLTVAACTSSACTRSAPATTRTLESAPEDITAPNLFVLGASVIEATWTAPVKPNGIILYYVLRRDNVIVYNGTDTRFTDRTVSPGKRYAYTITAINSAGQVTSSPRYSDNTNPSAPENVSTPTLRAVSPSSIEASWQPPGKPNGVIVRYFVMHSRTEVDVGLALRYTVQRLQPYTYYDFRIKACTAAGCTAGLSASARTLEAPPSNQSAPVFDIENVKARSVLVKWYRPLYPNGNITRYDLYRREPGRSKVLVFSGLSLFHTDSSATLKPNSRYEYQVRSFNGAGSASSVWSAVTTSVAPPESVHPVSVLENDISATAFVFYILEPTQPNGRIETYIVELTGVINITKSIATRGEAKNLKPYTEYFVKVHACNSAGCSSSPVKIVRTLAAPPSGFNSPPTVVTKTSRSVRLRWQAPLNPNGPIVGYQVSQDFACPQDSLPSTLCTPKQQIFNASKLLEHNITNLEPFIKYSYKITVHNTVGSRQTPGIEVTTLAEDPLVIGAPNVTVSGNTVKIDWTRSFRLRSKLEEYILEENLLQAYTGPRVRDERPNREVGVYTYVVRAKTNVNGRIVTVSTPDVSVNVGEVAPTASPRAADTVWYKEIWFIAMVALLFILLLFAIVVLLLRRFNGNRTVYVREREPLPERPKSKMGSRMGSRTVSRSSLNIANEKTYPYLQTPTSRRRSLEMIPVTPNLYSSTRDLLASTEIISQPKIVDQDLYFEDDPDTAWDGFVKEYHSKSTSNGKDRDSGLFEDNNYSPEPEDFEEPLGIQGLQKERVLFPDTHL